MKLETPFGSITATPRHVVMKATRAQAWAWSHRTGAGWPLSYMEQARSITAEFDGNGDLVDLIHPSTREVPADELNAWSSDLAAIALMTERDGDTIHALAMLVRW